MMAPSILDMFSLAGRTAMITGGTRGIGAEMAIALAEAGADIILIQVIYCPRTHRKGSDNFQIERYNKHCYQIQN